MTEIRSDLNMMTQLELVLAKAVAHGMMKQSFERLGFVDIASDSEEYNMEYNANMATLTIGHSFWSDDTSLVSKSGKLNLFMHQRNKIQKRMSKGKSTMTMSHVDDGVMGVNTLKEDPPVVKKEKASPTPIPEPQATPKLSSMTMPKYEQDEIEAVQNRVTLQHIQNSQLHDRMQPMVPDQGIIFDENNNPWL